MVAEPYPSLPQDVTDLAPGRYNQGLFPLFWCEAHDRRYEVLSQVEQGDPSAAEQLLPLVYDELRRLAAAKLAQEKSGQTLQATALVHEAYLRLLGPKGDAQFAGRGHFFAAAAEAMRRLLVERARRHKSEKRGGAWRRVELSNSDLMTLGTPDQIVAVDEALRCLEREEPDGTELVKLVVFGGFSVEKCPGRPHPGAGRPASWPLR
jgi:RNA polymerase sigma factor (TIGR02999 family)